MAAVNPLLDFQKIRLLGKGAFGVVYLAKHKASDEEVVIKIINTDNLSVKELQNSVQEGELLKMLDNPFIIKFKKLFQYKNTLSIIMEYADGSFNVISSGGDLSKKIKQANKRSFAEEQVMEWFCQILCAIKDIHSKNIIHRDIKSQNIFLTKEGVIKIGDFGVSTQTSSCASTVVGTPFYLSPEIINGAQYDSKTDIWSLGVLLYELCVLDYPFKVPNNSLAALALKILKGKFSPIPKQYSSDLSKLISTMLSVNPKSRPTIDQLMASRFIKNFVNKNALIQNAIAGTSFRIGEGQARFELPLVSKTNLKKQDSKFPLKRQAIEGSPIPEKKNGSALPEKKTMKKPAAVAVRKEDPKERLSAQAPVKKEMQKRVVEVKPTQKEEARRPRRAESDLNRSEIDSRRTFEDDAKKVQKKAEIEEMRKQMREDMQKKKRVASAHQENKNPAQFEVQIFTAAGKAVIDGQAETHSDQPDAASLSNELRLSANPQASQPSLGRGLSAQSEHQAKREPGIYVMDMPLKKTPENPRLRKAPEAKPPSRQSGKKEEKPGPTDSAPVFETASSSDSPHKAKLGFGANGFNSRFLDQKYSEDGIEIYIKGAPPVKRPVAEKSPQEGFRLKPVQSEQAPSRQSFVEISRQSADLHSEPALKSKSNVFLDSLADSSSKADFLKSRSSVLAASPAKESFFENMSLQQSETQEQSSSAKSEKTQKVLKFVPNSPEKKTPPLVRSPSKEAAAPAEQIEVDALQPAPSPEPATPRDSQNSPGKRSASKRDSEQKEQGAQEVRESLVFESEENFASVIENVSKLDTKKRLQDQINSSYAIIEVAAGDARRSGTRSRSA